MSTPSTVRSSVDSLRASVPSSWRAEDMPASLRHAEGFFHNRRGQSLSYLSLFPQEDDGTLRGVVVYLHGLGDHARRCFHVYEQLCEHGFGVVAYDLLSHGQSDSCEHRRRAHTRKFRYFVDDTNEFVAFAKRHIVPKLLSKNDNAAADEREGENTAARLPLILGAYSYGTLVALHTVLTGQHHFDGIFLVAPTVAVDLSPILCFQSVFAKPLSALAPRARIVPATKYEMLCRDPAFLDDLFSDPLAAPEKFMTVRMGAETLKAFASLQQDQALVDAESAFCATPVVFLMGSADQLLSLPITVAFFERIRNRDKLFKVFPGMYHSLFDDPEKDEVFAYLMTWLQARFPVKQRHISA
uniref:Serine aminopeptidase S33 domain-containing protein n=1 Tax=Globisporangium ultimum (strain ATCC 200006 / CBS 805.95 / DAOM BR144) TaxID=431595 RepID=K3WQY2_GLOUD